MGFFLLNTISEQN